MFFYESQHRRAGARRIVDIGTFIGYFALAMAEVLTEDSQIVTIENNRDHARIAQGFCDQSPDGSRIILRIGNAIEILRTLPVEGIDLVFIDADKRSYSAYYRESMRIVRPGA